MLLGDEGRESVLQAPAPGGVEVGVARRFEILDLLDQVLLLASQPVDVLVQCFLPFLTPIVEFVDGRTGGEEICAGGAEDGLDQQGGVRRVIRAGRLLRWSSCWPTGCGCSAPITRILRLPATTSAGGGVRRGTRPGRPSRSSSCWPTGCGCSAPITQTPLATRHNLAYWLGLAGDLAGAVAVDEQLVADRSRVLGPDHPDTLVARNDLARWRGLAGDPAGAAAAVEQLLADMVRVLGPDHPDTLVARNDLGRWRREAGDPAGAATAEEDR